MVVGRMHCGAGHLPVQGQKLEASQESVVIQEWDENSLDKGILRRRNNRIY